MWWGTALGAEAESVRFLVQKALFDGAGKGTQHGQAFLHTSNAEQFRVKISRKLIHFMLTQAKSLPYYEFDEINQLYNYIQRSIKYE
jgi:hypothetical protein